MNIKGKIAKLLKFLGAICLMVLFFCPNSTQAGDVMHPIKNPSNYTKGNCPNCGMNLNMWARTRHAFELPEGRLETCSIRCMADMGVKAGKQPQKVKVALYLQPGKMVEASTATYVVGSKAKGTMTMISKIAFASKTDAEKFAAANGGEPMHYQLTLTRATKELEMSRPKITMNRKKTGKIKDPTDADHCTVCGMFPARYPQHRSQVLTKSGDTLHFCSTKCLVSFVDSPDKFNKTPGDIMSIWVTVYPDGDYDYAKGLYYLVGSKIMGPMGAEPLPFRKKADAEAMAKKEGGKVLRFDDVKPDMSGHGGHHKMHHQ